MGGTTGAVAVSAKVAGHVFPTGPATTPFSSGGCLSPGEVRLVEPSAIDGRGLLGLARNLLGKVEALTARTQTEEIRVCL